MKYGVLGGTFDPPHAGHLALARAALDQLALDEVVLVPAFQNPLKSRKGTPASQRLAMVSLAVQDEPGLAVCDIEVTRKGPSYAVDTMEELRMVRPGEYWFVCGVDSLDDLQRWKEPKKLLSLCRLAVVDRSGHPVQAVLGRLPPEYAHRVDVVTMPAEPVSSSLLRDHIERGKPVNQWLKPAVWEYIEKLGLYRK